MASVADRLFASASETVSNPPDLGKAVAQGAQLAQTVQAMQAQRQAMEQKKQEHEINKVNSIVDTMKIASESKDPKLRKFIFDKVVPSKVTTLGLDKFFTPESLEMISASEEVQKKILGLQLDLDQKIRSGELTGAQAYKIAQETLSNPEELAMLPTDQIFEAQKFAASEEGKAYRAKLSADARKGTEGRLAGQFETNKIFDVKNKFDQNTRKDFERYTAANNALALLNTNQPISDEAVKTQLARLSGEVGNLTEADLSRFGGSRDLVERAKQLTSTLSTGKLTEENKKQLRVIAKEFKRIVEAKIRAQADRSVKGGKALGFDEGKLKAVIDVDNLLEGGNITDDGPRDPKIEDYAKQFGMDYSVAAKILEQRGYKAKGK